MGEERHGVLMHGIGRWFVHSRARAWVGVTFEIPGLLRDIPIPKRATCLDLATGMGWAGVGVLRRDASASVVAIDYDGEILPAAREYLRSHGVADRVWPCRADGKNLPFEDGRFDLVMCLYGLHHFRGFAAAVQEIARVLKPGGTFALIDPVRVDGKEPHAHHGLEVSTSEEVRRMLTEAGFEIVRARVSLRMLRAVARKRAA